MSFRKTRVPFDRPTGYRLVVLTSLGPRLESRQITNRQAPIAWPTGYRLVVLTSPGPRLRVAKTTEGRTGKFRQ